MFKDKLKELRKKEGLSQQELADKLFVSRSTVAKWENGNGIPSDVNLDAICNLFEVSKNELFGEGIINEFRETKNIKNKYKLGLLISLVLSSIIIILFSTIFIIQEHKHEQEYERFKDTMRENLNEPVVAFGNVDELYLNLINSKILNNVDNVFLNENDFYIVKYTNSQDIVEIIRHNYDFKEIGFFNFFLHNGYNANIVEIKTLSNNDILVVCNHETYFDDYYTYKGYSSITKLDEKYNILWEYTFVDLENWIDTVYEYNDKYYIFTTISELDDVSVSMTDAKISVLTNDGKLEKEEYITTQQWGHILAVSFINEMTRCLENPKQYAKNYNKEIFYKYKCTLETTVKEALQRLEAIENAKPSEAFEETKLLRGFNVVELKNDKNVNKSLDIIQHALLKAQEQEKENAEHGVDSGILRIRF